MQHTIELSYTFPCEYVLVFEFTLSFETTREQMCDEKRAGAGICLQETQNEFDDC